MHARLKQENVSMWGVFSNCAVHMCGPCTNQFLACSVLMPQNTPAGPSLTDPSFGAPTCTGPCNCTKVCSCAVSGAWPVNSAAFKRPDANGSKVQHRFETSVSFVSTLKIWCIGRSTSWPPKLKAPSHEKAPNNGPLVLGNVVYSRHFGAQ